MELSWHDRGARADEYLAAMRALWSMPHPTFAGSHVAFDSINAYPRPVRAAGPPIVVGGHSGAALRRAARHADGWYGVRLDLERARDLIARLHQVQVRHRAAPVS
jgi:alkanesulfonate monooxygenase SsuD/methylene tetrahydromethanopterin reductase-like flavin-dependent oxidoreductase (luciferase family)